MNVCLPWNKHGNEEEREEQRKRNEEPLPNGNRMIYPSILGWKSPFAERKGPRGRLNSFPHQNLCVLAMGERETMEKGGFFWIERISDGLKNDRTLLERGQPSKWALIVELFRYIYASTLNTLKLKTQIMYNKCICNNQNFPNILYIIIYNNHIKTHEDFSILPRTPDSKQLIKFYHLEQPITSILYNEMNLPMKFTAPSTASQYSF